MSKESKISVRTKQHGKFEIREVLPENGKANESFNIYKHKGKILPKIKLTGHYVEQIKAFAYLDKDLRNVAHWLKELEVITKDYDSIKHFEEPDVKIGMLVKSYYVSSLITYGKCFSDATDRKFTLNRKHVPEKYKAIHENAINARNNFAAHKGVFEAEICDVSLVIIPSKKNPDFEVFTELKQVNYQVSEEMDFPKFIALCDALREVIKEKKIKVVENMINEKILSQTMSFWVERNGSVININSLKK